MAAGMGCSVAPPPPPPLDAGTGSDEDFNAPSAASGDAARIAAMAIQIADLEKKLLKQLQAAHGFGPGPGPGCEGGGGQINPQIPDNDVDFDKVDTNAVDVADQWLDSFTFDMFEPTNNDTPNATPNDLEHCLAEPIAALTIPIAALVQPQTTPKSRRRKVAVPASQKTERYWKRRGSNTESARKSRHKAKLIRLLRAAAKAAPPIPVEEKEEGNIDVAADADEI